MLPGYERGDKYVSSPYKCGPYHFLIGKNFMETVLNRR
jgi:hypothetical protein